MLTQKRLRAVLHYDPRTGIFTWTSGHKKGEVAGTKHDSRGFLKVSIDSERHLLHRLAWLSMTGLMPPWSVGHVDGNHANNRWPNLCRGDRIQPDLYRATWSEPTRLKGAFRTGDGFAAMIPAEGIMVNLGTFRTVEEASAVAIGAVQRARAKHRAGHQPERIPPARRATPSQPKTDRSRGRGSRSGFAGADSRVTSVILKQM